MLNFFPNNTAVTANVKAFEYFKGADPYEMTDRLLASSEILLSGEFLGWQAYIPAKGKPKISLFGSDCATVEDLRWIAGSNIFLSTSKGKIPQASFARELYEIDFDTDLIRWDHEESVYSERDYRKFNEFVERLSDKGAFLRVVCGHAGKNSSSVRYLLALPEQPPLRLRTVLSECIRGCELAFRGMLDEPSVRALWDDPFSEEVPDPLIMGRFRYLPFLQPFPIKGKSEVLAVRTAGIMDNMLRQTQEMFGDIPEDELANIPLDSLGLSVRSYNCLKRASLNTLKDIVRCPALARVRNLSSKNIIEIDKVLKDTFANLRRGRGAA